MAYFKDAGTAGNVHAMTGLRLCYSRSQHVVGLSMAVDVELTCHSLQRCAPVFFPSLPYYLCLLYLIKRSIGGVPMP